LKALLNKVFNDKGLRLVFSTRSAVPFIQNQGGQALFDGEYQFTPGKDEIIREGDQGYVVSYGEMLYRCLDAVDRLREEGTRVGLINKPTLNVVDEEMMTRLGSSGFVLLVETQSVKSGLGARFGTWLLERGYSTPYAHLGVTREGHGGVVEQIAFQDLDPDDILNKIRSMIQGNA
jgi:transketolase C-terminal domain/subunit